MSEKTFVKIGDELIRLDHIARVLKQSSANGKSVIWIDFHNTPRDEIGIHADNDDPTYAEALAVYNYIKTNMVMDLTAKTSVEDSPRYKEFPVQTVCNECGKEKNSTRFLDKYTGHQCTDCMPF